MRKKILLFLIFIVGFLFVGCENIDRYETDQFELLIFNENISIVGYKEGYYSENLVINNTVTYYDTKLGTYITGYADRVDEYSFQNIDLLSVEIINTGIPEFTQIMDYAFEDNERLASVTLPLSLIEIKQYAFANNPSLIEINLNSVTILGDNVFFNCTSLNTIILGSEIEYIGNNAFENCSDALEIYISNPNPPEIGNDIFKNIESFSIFVPEEQLSLYKTYEGWSSYAANIYAYL